MKLISVVLACFAAVGMVAFASADARAELLAYEGFATEGYLDGSYGSPNSFGFTAPWTADTGDYSHSNATPTTAPKLGLVEGNLPLPSNNLGSEGGMMRLFSAHGSTVTATRPLGTSIIADSGDTWYISFAAQKNTDYSTPWAFMGLTNTSGISAARIRAGFNGISPDNRIAAAIGCRDAFGTESNTVNSTDALANEPVFYVLKIDTTTDGTLNLSMNYYFQNETLPIDEPTSWALQTSQSGMSGVSYDIAYIQGRSGVNYGGTGAFFDEFRLGTTWQDVAAEVPEPSTFALLGMGLFGLLAYAWRKRR